MEQISLSFNGKPVINNSIVHSYDAISPKVEYSTSNANDIIVLANIDTDTAYWFLSSTGGKEKEIIPFTSPTAGNYLFLVFTPPQGGLMLKQPISPNNFRKQYRKSDLGTLIGSIKFKVDNDIELIRQIKSISGPSSFYYYTIPYLLNGIEMNKRFYLFGDIHGGRENTCETTSNTNCSTFPSSDHKSNLEKSKCLDIGNVLDELFIFSKNHQITTDFFLEFPYKIDQIPTQLDREIELLPTLTEEEKALWFSVHEYIPSLYAQFYPCFIQNKEKIREKCELNPYVRFQYADIRQLHQSGPVILQTFIYLQIQELNEIAITITKLAYSNKKPTLAFSQKFRLQLETVNSLILQSNEDKLLEFFNIMIYSDSFSQDLIKFFASFIPLTGPVKDKLASMEEDLLQLSTQRYGKDYSRVRAQLIEIDKEGIEFYIIPKRDPPLGGLSIEKKKASDAIIEYIQTEYYRLLETLNYQEWKVGYNLLKNYKPLPEDWGQDFNLVKFDALFMDAYVLARSFRAYANPKYPERRKGEESEVVVVYSGAAHSQNYSKFFSEYLGVKPLESIDRTIYGQRCISKEGLGENLVTKD
jgi:hypothetical protein